MPDAMNITNQKSKKINVRREKRNRDNSKHGDKYRRGCENI
jgi:hypothetical protein